MACGILMGKANQAGWNQAERTTDFYDVKDNDETEFEQCLKAINDNLKKSQLFIHIEHQMKVEKRVLMLMIIADFASMFQKYLRNIMWQ